MHLSKNIRFEDILSHYRVKGKDFAAHGPMAFSSCMTTYANHIMKMKEEKALVFSG